MAISEDTKVAVAGLKAQMGAEYTLNEREIAEHQTIIASLQARNLAIKKQLDAVKLDIADPTPVEMPK